MQCRIIGQEYVDKQRYLPDWRAGARELTHAATRARVRASCELRSAEGNHPGALFVTDAEFKNLQRVTHSKAPLRLMTEEPDHKVLVRQALEIDYALRHPNQEAAWFNYTSSGHGLPLSTIEEVHNYLRCIVQCYDAAFEG